MENNIQKSLRWICTALFPILCIGMIWFLQNFTKLDTSIQYIDWQTAVKIGQDDSLTELDYSVPPETGERFRLETVIPANSKYGNLVFETAGMNLTVSIDEKAVWQSETCVKSNMVYTLCKHMVYMLSITNEHKNELEMRAKPEWKVHFLCFASAKRGSFSIR